MAYYCIDTGIINSIAFRFSEDIGKVMENLVAVELHRRKSYYGAAEVYYWKDHRQREVDFVLKEGDAIKELIQVSYASSENDIEEREITALLKASEELNCGNPSIITWDYEGEIGEIKCTPLWKWLLMAPDFSKYPIPTNIPITANKITTKKITSPHFVSRNAHTPALSVLPACPLFQ